MSLEVPIRGVVLPWHGLVLVRVLNIEVLVFYLAWDRLSGRGPFSIFAPVGQRAGMVGCLRGDVSFGGAFACRVRLPFERRVRPCFPLALSIGGRQQVFPEVIQRLWSIAWALPFLLLAGRVLRFCATLVSSLGRPMRMADCLLVAREDPRWGQLVAATIPLPQRGPSGRRRAGRWAIDPGATRWRAQDFPLRHVLRMAAWNAPGWPYRLVRSSFRPALGRVLEEVAECDPEGGLSVRECMYRAALSAPGWTPSPPRRALRAMLGSVTEAEEESSWGISRRRAIDRQLMVDLVSGRGWSAASWPPSFCPACCVVSDPDAVFEMRGPHVAQTSGGLELSNRFSPLQCEEVESEGGPEDELSCQPSGRPPG